MPDVRQSPCGGIRLLQPALELCAKDLPAKKRGSPSILRGGWRILDADRWRPEDEIAIRRRGRHTAAVEGRREVTGKMRGVASIAQRPGSCRVGNCQVRRIIFMTQLPTTTAAPVATNPATARQLLKKAFKAVIVAGMSLVLAVMVMLAVMLGSAIR